MNAISRLNPYYQDKVDINSFLLTKKQLSLRFNWEITSGLLPECLVKKLQDLQESIIRKVDIFINERQEDSEPSIEEFFLIYKELLNEYNLFIHFFRKEFLKNPKKYLKISEINSFIKAQFAYKSWIGKLQRLKSENLVESS
ncbi:hypothetical protein GYA19_04050 [Candidatus Beckwithbacteria bacterium]|nr:hypothetical protein [Candidatus Beckwithbacteria bacterium]